MKIRIICVGKIKEKFYRDAIAEYMKRLGRYVTAEIVELADEKAPENLSDKEKEQILDKEGSRILGAIKEKDHVIALAIEGKHLTSKGLAGYIDDHMKYGGNDIDMVIGGSYGLSKTVMDRSDMRLSFSDMTFPHQLMRVILLEQIYRSFRIIRNEPYDK